MCSVRYALVIVVLSISFFQAIAQSSDCANQLEGPCAKQEISLRMNDLQAVGSHNSYKLAIPDTELAIISDYSEQSARSLDYSHLSLSTQLDMGLRQIELDIFHDPEGGRFADPLLPRQASETYGALPYDDSAMRHPGFKVLHSQDIDVRSTCPSWISCLIEIKRWSDSHPQHVPILIMINAKDGGSAYPGVKPALDFTARAYRALDDETLSVFPFDRIIKPDDVRGSYRTLREAVLADNWPLLDAVRGKVLFALDETPEKVRIYMDGEPSLEGLPMFVNSIDENEEHAAYFTLNDPLRSQDQISAAVSAGFIVRTRADANTLEARINSTDRREAAFRSGAHYISTDYYVPRPEFSDYSVGLPEGVPARCNPVRLRNNCNGRP